MLPLILVHVLACVLSFADAQAHTQLVAHDGRLHAGPQTARGAVIWSHAGEAPRQADPEPAIFLDQLRDTGFDIWRLERRPEGDTLSASRRALVQAAQQLRGQGYRQLVLAGQSAGGWISIAAAVELGAAVDAVVATAPAAFGRVADNPTRAQRNRDDLLQMAQRVGETRVMVFFFDGDGFDPGGRGAPLTQILAQRGDRHAVIDRPTEFRGHDVGLSRGFARRYGPCIKAFIIADRPETNFTCAGMPEANLPYEFEIPIRPLRAANDNVPLRPLIGRWSGTLDNGDDVMLVVTGGRPDRIDAVFARARSRPALYDRSFVQERQGRLDGSDRRLVFESVGRPTIIATPNGRHELRVDIATADDTRRFAGTLRRVE